MNALPKTAELQQPEINLPILEHVEAKRPLQKGEDKTSVYLTNKEEIQQHGKLGAEYT